MNKIIRLIRFILRTTRELLSQKPITIEYPFVKKSIANAAKSQIGNEFDLCTACGDCEKICPMGAIEIQGDNYIAEALMPKLKSQKRLQKDLQAFLLRYDACNFCGLCVQNCPENSLYFMKKFPPKGTRRDSLVVDLYEPYKLRKK